MKSSTLSVSVVSVGLSMALSLSPAYAETSDTTTSTRPIQGRLEQVREAECDRLRERMETNQANFQERVEQTEVLFKKQDERLAALIDKAAEQGVYVTQLTEMLDTWQQFRYDIIDIREENKGLVEAAVEAICAGDRETGRNNFSTVRENVKEIRELRRERRDYYRNTIVPELKSIRQEIVDSLKGSTSATDRKKSF